MVDSGGSLVLVKSGACSGGGVNLRVTMLERPRLRLLTAVQSVAMLAGLQVVVVKCRCTRVSMNAGMSCLQGWLLRREGVSEHYCELQITCCLIYASRGKIFPDVCNHVMRQGMDPSLIVLNRVPCTPI